MQVTFTPTTPENFVPEHSAFISKLILEMSLNRTFLPEDIIYPSKPYNAQVVRFSDYLKSYGCTQQNHTFVGYFGSRSYKDTLQQFLIETLADYQTPFVIEIDVKDNMETNPTDLSTCLEIMTNNLKKEKGD